MPTPSDALDAFSRWTLFAIYELSGASQPVSVSSLAAALGAPPIAVVRALSTLEARGWVWAARCALTMPGLAVAASLASRYRARRSAA